MRRFRGLIAGLLSAFICGAAAVTLTYDGAGKLSGGLGTYQASVLFDTTMQVSVTRSIWAPSTVPIEPQNIPLAPFILQLLFGISLITVALNARRPVKKMKPPGASGND